MPTSLATALLQLTKYNPKCLSCSAAKKHSDLATRQVGTNSLLRYMHMTPQVAQSPCVLNLNQLQKHKVTTAQGTMYSGFGDTTGWQPFFCVWDTYTWHHRAGARWLNWQANQSFALHKRHIRVCSKGHVWTTPSQRFADSHIHRQTSQSWLKLTYRQSFIIPTDTASLL
jgi:hypothetical protein